MRRVIAILFLFFSVTFLALGQRVYLVCVGVADYPGTKNDLRLPARDARSMFELYTKYTEGETILITDKRATKQNIKEKAHDLFAKAGKNDIVIFFFSGHGASNGSFVAYDGFLSYDEVRTLFSSCKAANKMIFADACFSGRIRTASSNASTQTSDSRLTSSNVMMFLSSRSNEYSLETKGMKNGFFTTCLLRCLKGAADKDSDRVITAKELFSAVQSGVVTLSRGKQHPVMWGSFSDDMPVFVWK